MARGTACEWLGKKSAKTKKKQVKKSEVSPTHSRRLKERKETKKLTVDDFLNLMEAGGQLCLLVGPGGALAFELGQESSLSLLCLALRLLEQLPLLRQLRSQQVALRGEFAALLPLGMQGGVGLAQLLLKSGVGP